MSIHQLILTSLMITNSFASDLTSIPFQDATGNKSSLATYRGKVMLLVNLASKCGLTPQYRGLEGLYKKHRDGGLVVIGFPCNDFGGQEPGSIKEIQTFCKTEYDVTFPVMDKISVKGEKQHLLYAALTDKNAAFPGEVQWNFGKFLIGKDGEVIARFEPAVSPESPELVAAIEKALTAPVK